MRRPGRGSCTRREGRAPEPGLVVASPSRRSSRPRADTPDPAAAPRPLTAPEGCAGRRPVPALPGPSGAQPGVPGRFHRPQTRTLSRGRPPSPATPTLPSETAPRPVASFSPAAATAALSAPGRAQPAAEPSGQHRPFHSIGPGGLRPLASSCVTSAGRCGRGAQAHRAPPKRILRAEALEGGAGYRALREAAVPRAPLAAG